MQFLTTTESYISLFFTLALMLVMLYFMIYRPQKKQEKKDIRFLQIRNVSFFCSIQTIMEFPLLSVMSRQDIWM